MSHRHTTDASPTQLVTRLKSGQCVGRLSVDSRPTVTFSNAYLTVVWTVVSTRHSFRIGDASHVTEKGYFDVQICALGCWKSDTFKVYLRLEVLHAN